MVDVDERDFEAAVVRRYGRASRGQKVYGLRPGHARPCTCFLAAQIDGTLQATQLWEGTWNAQFFNHWLEEFLCPVLHENHVVVMDKSAFHKSSNTHELMEQTWVILLFLSPYSPDVNPIEHDFAAIKNTREFHEYETIDHIIQSYN